MNTAQVWLVTGASKGLGLALVQKLLEKGFRVAATSRRVDELRKAVGEPGEAFLPLAMNLLDEADVQQAIATAVAHFGRMDVVVNNAGYILAGAVEELTDAEARANFDVNVFGSLNVIRQVLPHMRRQGSGHVFNISSIGGFSGGFPGFGIYCATKFAVHGFTESMGAELRPLGINTTLVMPGYFRTNLLNADAMNTPKNELAAYANVREVQAAHQHQINQNQPGDPVKAAEVLIAVAQHEQPPMHLFLGEDAYELAAQKLTLVQQEMEAHRQLATATSFEALAANG